MNRIYVLSAVFLFVVVYLFMEHMHSNTTKVEKNISIKNDKGTLEAIKSGIFYSYILAFAAAIVFFPMYLESYYWLFLGIGIVTIGLFIRMRSIRQLDKRFTYMVTKLHDHPLETSGIYSTIRHPGYLGQLIIFFGTGILMQNIYSAAILLLGITPFYIVRMNVEEQFLSNQFGEAYDAYRKRTKRLIPHFY